MLSHRPLINHPLPSTQEKNYEKKGTIKTLSLNNGFARHFAIMTVSVKEQVNPRELSNLEENDT